MELETIRSMIYEVRGVRVMLDFDLARLYQVENRTLKQAVRRNMDRFPGDFMLKLTKDEANELILISWARAGFCFYRRGGSHAVSRIEKRLCVLLSR